MMLDGFYRLVSKERIHLFHSPQALAWGITRRRNAGNHFNGFLLRAIPSRIALQTSRILPNTFACDDALLDLRYI